MVYYGSGEHNTLHRFEVEYSISWNLNLNQIKYKLLYSITKNYSGANIIDNCSGCVVFFKFSQLSSYSPGFIRGVVAKDCVK